ncbi:hypothetical protein BDD12DRAFT_731468, partial [Trichophaea hybrida]
MVFAIRLWLVLIALSIPEIAYADTGDDYSNNLFTDLAPLLALFGEQFAKQFMSQSMNWLDHIVFAMAPLGILTAIVAAIRVGGPSWLRAVVGRARENLAAVEVELMSSTSHEVCELWNGHGVVRSTGMPEVQQIIYLDALKRNPRTFGLYTKVSEEKKNNTDEELGARSNGNEQLQPKPQQKSAPNIALNIQGGSRPRDLYFAAIGGALFQFGMLVFCGFTVYHPTFSSRFPKNSAKVKPYAFPVMAVGTIALMCGMLICSAVIERSTEETVFTPQLRARILWLQKTHTVSDQTFDSFIIFGRNKNVSSTLDQAFTLLGVFLGLAGFILQFQGLRGMNWSASIAQLVCIMLMTTWRAWVRRGLIAIPIAHQVLDQHEMDWLALKI